MRFGPALALAFLAGLIWFRPVLPAAPGAQLVSSFDWVSDDIGGLSALAVRNDGQSAYMLMDKASLFDVDFSREQDRITAAHIRGTYPLVENIRAKGAKFDTEGLAIAPDGTVFVSYEQDHRIRRYDLINVREEVVNTPRAFQAFGKNAGLEALAMDRRGHLFTLPEVPTSRRRGFPLWQWDKTGWTQIQSLPARDGFLAVSADFGPDGRFYLLERKLSVLGFQTRLRRWTMVGAMLQDETVLLTTPAGQFGNLEGVSLWRDSGGQLRATMVADDNFWPIMRMQIVEFLLTEELARLPPPG